MRESVRRSRTVIRSAPTQLCMLDRGAGCTCRICRPQGDRRSSRLRLGGADRSGTASRAADPASRAPRLPSGVRPGTGRPSGPDRHRDCGGHDLGRTGDVSSSPEDGTGFGLEVDAEKDHSEVEVEVQVENRSRLEPGEALSVALGSRTDRRSNSRRRSTTVGSVSSHGASHETEPPFAGHSRREAVRHPPTVGAPWRPSPTHGRTSRKAGRHHRRRTCPRRRAPTAAAPRHGPRARPSSSRDPRSCEPPAPPPAVRRACGSHVAPPRPRWPPAVP